LGKEFHRLNGEQGDHGLNGAGGLIGSEGLAFNFSKHFIICEISPAKLLHFLPDSYLCDPN
jgi:hypothetical protein